MSFIAILLLGLAAWAAHAGVFYQTGPQWFEACWNKQHASRGASRRIASEPKQAVAWAQCEPMALAATYSLGVVFVPQYDDTIISLSDADKLLPACPWAETVPDGEWYTIVVARIEGRGGPSFIEGFLPASYMLEDVISKNWPHCRSASGYLGYGITSEGIPYHIRDSDQADEETLRHFDALLEILDKYEDDAGELRKPGDVQ